MDVNFKCPHCEQQLTVDATLSGTENQCPSCGNTIVIPQTGATAPHVINAMAASAAAKEEKHFKVPVHEKADVQPLIAKPLAPLDVAAKEGIHLRVKSIRRSDCVEVGKDHFDEFVTDFLGKIGEANIVSVSTFNYTHMDLATRAWVTDYGAFIVYRG